MSEKKYQNEIRQTEFFEREAAAIMGKGIRGIYIAAITVLCLFLFSSGTAENEIVLPSHLQKISNECFSNCESITSVRIPASVNQILPQAFQNCTALTGVYIPESVNDIADDAFNDCPNCVFYVFRDSYAEKWALWNMKNFVYINNEQHQYGDYYYCLNSSKTASIIRYSGESTGSLIVPDSIEGYMITSIEEQAFIDCTATSIQLPSFLKSIGHEAFYYSKAAEIIIPSSVEKIESEAFMCCHSLTHIYIPSSVKEMGNNPFRGCRSLSSITVDPDNTIFGIYDNALISKADMKLIVYPYALIGDTLTIPEGIKIIGGTAFGYEGPKIKTLNIPDTVEKIEGSAFSFSSVQHIYIGSGIKEMGYGPFTYCEALEDVTIADGTTYIGSGAFSHCGKLESIVIPNSVNYIADNAFDYDYNICIIAEPDSYAMEYARNNGLADKQKYGDFLYSICDNDITIIRYTGEETMQLVVPASINGLSVTAIGENAFEDCPASSIVLPETLLSIGHEAFYYCKATSINIPESVTTIESEAFMCCNKITEFNIPASVTSMGSNPFRGCRGLQTITVDNDNTRYSIFCNALVETENMRLIVYPYGLVTDTFTIPDGIKIIGSISFGYEGPRFSKLIIPDSVTTIESSAFPFSRVQEIVIGSGVQEMGYGVFTYCDSLQTVTIAEGATVIGNGAFRHCDNLATITIPDSVTQIAEDAFEYDYEINIIGSANSEAIQYAKRKGYNYTIK